MIQPLARATVWVVASTDTAARWARALEDAGHPARALAWSAVACVPVDAGAWPAGPFDRMLLTSANAVRCLPDAAPRALPAACVGEGTAVAAREAGLVVAEVGTGTGAELAALLVAVRPALARVLFPRGQDVRREGVDLLAAAGIDVAEVVVYEARPRADFPREVGEASLPAAMVVGSPRAARALAAVARRDLRPIPVVAPGPSTAEALADCGFERVGTAVRPDAAGLSAVLADLLRGDPSA